MFELKEDYITLLLNSELFNGLTKQEVLTFANASEIIIYRQNDVIFRQGSTSEDMFLVLKGSIRLVMDPELFLDLSPGSTAQHVIAVVEAGHLFGEMTFFDKQPRSATAVAKDEGTKLLKISPISLDVSPDKTANPDITATTRQAVLRNLIKQLSNKIRLSNQLLAQEKMAGYYLTTMVNEISSEYFHSDWLNPLIKTIVIKDPESFSLSFLIASELKRAITKEIIDVHFFSIPTTLKMLLSPRRPAGESILYALFYFIRTGDLPEKVDKGAYQVHLNESGDRRSGTFKIKKSGKRKRFVLSWQIKGLLSKKNQLFGNLFITIYADEHESVETKVSEIISQYAMPIQNHLFAEIKKSPLTFSNYRVLMIHHRTHEVISTLEKIKRCGMVLERFIGIPYGEASWETNTLLNEVSQNRYMVLRNISDSKGASAYVFDFKSSSFLSRMEEKSFLRLFNKDNKISEDYLLVMQRLAKYCLIEAINTCEKKKQRLIIYEDGGYLADIIYKLYFNPEGVHHHLIKKAVDEGLIVGIVEGTLSGHRKHQYHIKSHQRALLPTLSSARSLIKEVYESKGIAESIIHSAATALGRLGLPTFFGRKIAVIGGNGVIGTRLVEQLVFLQGNASHVVVVDVKESPTQPLLNSDYPSLQKALLYSNLPRFFIQEGSKVLDFTAFLSLDDFWNQLLLQKNSTHPVVVINFSKDYKDAFEQKLKKNAYQWVSHEVEKNSWCFEYHVSRDKFKIKLLLLTANVVIAAKKISPLVVRHSEVLIGTTGYAVMSAMDLIAFLKKKNKKDKDALVLISGSSKDTEFKSCILFLDALIELQSAKRSSASLIKQLLIYKDEYQQLLSNVFLKKIIWHAFINHSSVDELLKNIPELRPLKQPLEKNVKKSPEILFNYIQAAIFSHIQISKEIRPDVGMNYTLQIGKNRKSIHLLANGQVINFYAKHEKGAKSEYIDPIMTIQFLSVVWLTQNPRSTAGLYDAAEQINPKHIKYMWESLEGFHSPWIHSSK